MLEGEALITQIRALTASGKILMIIHDILKFLHLLAIIGLANPGTSAIQDIPTCLIGRETTTDSSESAQILGVFFCSFEGCSNKVVHCCVGVCVVQRALEWN
jgi:hypothetical protein